MPTHKTRGRGKLRISQHADQTPGPQADWRRTEEVPGKLVRLKQLLDQHETNCWQIADALVDIIDTHRVPLGWLSKQTGYSKPRLSEFHRTARLFPTNKRRGLSFQDCVLGRQVYTRLPALGWTPHQIAREVQKLRGRRPQQVKAHFVQILVRQSTQRSIATAARQDSKSSSVIGRCHHADWIDIIPKLPDRAVKLFIADPPFGGYQWRAHGGYLSSRSMTSGLRCDTDNNSADEAMAVTLPLFERCQPKLAEGGCLLLFQPGGKPDRVEILTEAARHGWSCLYGVIWQKNSSGPTDCANPYAPASERILVFAREGERLEWHEQGLSRSDVLSFPMLTQRATLDMHHGRTEYGTIHMFQKPPALLEFLVRMHTYKGDLVVEPFGCSGSGCIAAARLGRRWCYVESNEQNFRWGSQRVMQEVQSADAG